MSRGWKYLSRETVRKQDAKQKRLVILGWILTAFFGFATIAGAVGYSEDLRKYLLVYVVFLIPSVFLLNRGYSIGHLTGAAKRYESIFAADRDGIVTVEELAGQTGMPEARIFKDLESLFRAGYFHNCTLQREGRPCVRISDARVNESGVGFVTVQCTKCGGTTRIRAGYKGVCEYCGAPVSATEH